VGKLPDSFGITAGSYDQTMNVDSLGLNHTYVYWDHGVEINKGLTRGQTLEIDPFDGDMTLDALVDIYVFVRPAGKDDEKRLVFYGWAWGQALRDLWTKVYLLYPNPEQREHHGPKYWLALQQDSIHLRPMPELFAMMSGYRQEELIQRGALKLP
jgi:hypothetical protein